jgi:hypothetical protein
LSYVNASSCALSNSGVDFREMDKGNSLGEQNQMSKEKENLRKHDGLFWLLGFIFCSLVSLPVHAAQPTRDLKEIKVAYPPSMASG